MNTATTPVAPLFSSYQKVVIGMLALYLAQGGPLSLLNPVNVLKSHPNPLARIPLLQAVARTWHQQHPR